MTIAECKLIDLPKFLDSRGNLSFVENYTHVPFEIIRAYWIYDVPGGEKRDGHAYKENQEFIIALSGAFDVTVDDGKNKKTFSLNRSYNGLYIPKGLWRELDNFSTNAFAMILSSTKFDLNDYILDYQVFKALQNYE
ncbi:WxcM Domain-Containing Protein [Bacteroidales bacterium CF]|jgi:WxcM-like, C-terminal.|nr:WxcM Domain-Containing Protein [Bacteroidales bacterium CF]